MLGFIDILSVILYLFINLFKIKLAIYCQLFIIWVHTKKGNPMKTIEYFGKLTAEQQRDALQAGYIGISATAITADDVERAIEMMRSGETFACMVGAAMMQNRAAIQSALKN